MNVFLSYAVGPLDTPIAARLRAVAAAYDIVIFLPDRTQVIQNGLLVDTKEKIQQSDALIALVTRTATTQGVQVVLSELQFATQKGKAIVALVEMGIQIQPGSGAQIVLFDRSNPTAHEPQLMSALNNIRQRQPKDVLTALGWIAGIALGLVALGSLINDKTD